MFHFTYGDCHVAIDGLEVEEEFIFTELIV
jgi:hypothetical protein